MSTPDPLDLLWFDPSFWEDPYPGLAALREQAPVRYNAVANFWTVVRHADVEAALQDARLTTVRPIESFPHKVPAEELPMLHAIGEYTVGFLKTFDPTARTRQRALVQKAFGLRSADAFRPRVRQFVDRKLAGARADEPFDWMAEIARPLPTVVGMQLLGVPEEGQARVKVAADGVYEFLGAIGDLEPGRVTALWRQLEACSEYLLPLVAERRARPKDDLISSFAAVTDGGEALADREISVLTTMMLFASQETTTNLLGNGMMALLRHPEQLARLRDEPGRLPGAVEEMLRYDPPLQFAARFPDVDVELGGQPVRKNEMVLLVMASANRDPARFADADRFDVTRPPSRHLSFGYGPHFCLGAQLARAEAHEVFTEALGRFSRWELVPERTSRRFHPLMRGFETLGVRFEA